MQSDARMGAAVAPGLSMSDSRSVRIRAAASLPTPAVSDGRVQCDARIGVSHSAVAEYEHQQVDEQSSSCLVAHTRHISRLPQCDARIGVSV